MLPENITACLFILLGNVVFLVSFYLAWKFKWNNFWFNILNSFLPSFVFAAIVRGWGMLCSFYFTSERVPLYAVQMGCIVLNMIVLALAAVTIKKRYQTK